MPSMVPRSSPQSKDQETHSHSLFLSLYAALFLSLSDTRRKTIFLPHQLLVPLSHALPRLLLAGALLCEPLSYRLIPLCTPWHEDSDDDKKSIKEKEVQEEKKEEERTTALDLKKQQLQQPHCHSNICFMLSAAAGQLKAWEPQNCHSVASLAQRTGLILFRAATISSLFN